MTVKSKRGALRRYNAIIRAIYRDLRGGTSYGVDWPTIRVTFPERYAELQALHAVWSSLPE